MKKSSIENFKTILIGLLLMAVIKLTIFPPQTANAGVATFKTALVAAVTAHFSPTDRTRVANAYVSANQAEWNARVASGTVDNDNNRREFAGDQITAMILFTVYSEERRMSVSALPTPTPLPQE